jgi:hypothetical protein
MSIIDLFRLFLFVREAGQNHGLRVEAIQHWGGGQPGDSWCAWLLTMVFDLFYQGRSRLPRGGSTEAIHQLAIREGWIVTDPQPGDVVISLNADGLAHHIALVTVVQPLTAIAGNTSADGRSANGDRVAEHPIDPANKVFARVPPPPVLS